MLSQVELHDTQWNALVPDPLSASVTRCRQMVEPGDLMSVRSKRIIGSAPCECIAERSEAIA